MNTVLLAASLLLASAPVTAAPKPSPPAPAPLEGYDGRWLLDARRSDFGGPQSALRWREDQMTCRGEQVTVHSRYVRAGGDSVSLDYTYRADGEATNDLRGQAVKTRGRHSGRALEFVSTIKFLVAEIRSEERWWLAGTGDTLIREIAAHSPLGNQHQMLYFGRMR